MRSPCIVYCIYDDNRKCEGCGRTFNEVSEWTEYTDEERDTVLTRLVEENNNKINYLEQELTLTELKINFFKSRNERIINGKK